MTALAITATLVVSGAGTPRKTKMAGETITQGQAIVMDPTTKKMFKTDVNDNTNTWKRACDGIALNAASLNQPVVFQTDDDITMGATLTVGEVYCAGNTPGAIVPKADLTTGDYMVILGVAKSASVLGLNINNSGVPLP